MYFRKHAKKSIGFVAAFLFVATGTYNAVVINSDSTITSHDVKFVKRLDEMYGVVTPGRMVAASTNWKKLGPEDMKQFQNVVIQNINKVDAAPVKSIDNKGKEETPQVVAAAVQEELDLKLTEVINPRKWQQGLQATQFDGNLITNNGTIENLSVALPNGEGISVSFSEMTGNVFEYDLDGEVYSGMMYQVDQSTYMVTLTNGPLEGTRLRFAQNTIAEQQEITQNQLADQQVEVGTFGQVDPQQLQPDSINQYDQNLQAQAEQTLNQGQVQGFNMEQQPLTY